MTNVRDRSTELGGFRWTCPFCGTSRLNSSGPVAGERNAVAALRTHVQASADARHGPRNEFPAGFDRGGLADHVIEVDGRGDAVGSEE